MNCGVKVQKHLTKVLLTATLAASSEHGGGGQSNNGGRGGRGCGRDSGEDKVDVVKGPNTMLIVVYVDIKLWSQSSKISDNGSSNSNPCCLI